MSIIFKLLGFTGLPQWAIELIAVAAVALAVAAYRHHVYDLGKAAEIAIIKADDERKTAEAQKRADTAEDGHKNALADLEAYRAAHPDEPVRLCLDGLTLPASGSPGPGNRPTRAAPGSFQPVPAGDPSSGPQAVGPDIFGLLDALAARSDKVSEQLRVYQKVTPP